MCNLNLNILEILCMCMCTHVGNNVYVSMSASRTGNNNACYSRRFVDLMAERLCIHVQAKYMTHTQYYKQLHLLYST